MQAAGRRLANDKLVFHATACKKTHLPLAKLHAVFGTVGSGTAEYTEFLETGNSSIALS